MVATPERLNASQGLFRFTVPDLTRIRSGPTSVRQLADWGANVIKIDTLSEQPRRAPPRFGFPELAAQQPRDNA